MAAKKMDLKNVKKRRIYEEIVIQIKDQIAKGKLKAGDQLPTEREMAEVFNVSRHSVREAIRALEQKNILSSRPGSGTFVVLDEEQSILDYFAHAVMHEKERLNEIFEVRRMLEPQIAALAAKNADYSDCYALEKIIEQQQANDISTEQFIKLDNEFHKQIARSTQNKVLIKITESLNDILMECRQASYQSPERKKLSTEGHKSILKAIVEKRPDISSKLMEEHLRSVEYAIGETIKIKRGNIQIKPYK